MVKNDLAIKKRLLTNLSINHTYALNILLSTCLFIYIHLGRTTVVLNTDTSSSKYSSQLPVCSSIFIQEEEQLYLILTLKFKYSSQLPVCSSIFIQEEEQLYLIVHYVLITFLLIEDKCFLLVQQLLVLDAHFLYNIYHRLTPPLTTLRLALSIIYMFVDRFRGQLSFTTQY